MAAPEAIVLGPDDRLVLVWPKELTIREFDDIRARMGGASFTDRVLHVVGVEQLAVLRSPMAAGSTVGLCEDSEPGLSPSMVPLSCHLAAGHTGRHTDGSAIWSRS